MRSFIVLSCILAVASAGIFHSPLAYRANAAVVDQNGYKIDEIGAYNALPLAAPWPSPVLAARTLVSPIAASIAAPVAYAVNYKWAGPQHLPVIGPNGVPLDTPEVAAGKVANAVAHVEAKARNGDIAIAAPLVAPIAAPVALVAEQKWAGPQHIPVIGPNGVPLDTPEVAAGKAANAAAHAEANARNGDIAIAAPLTASIVSPVTYAAEYKWAGPQHIPVIGPNGVPLDTPEVAAGKAANAAAHLEAKARNGDIAVAAPIAQISSPVIAARGLVDPWAAPITSYTSQYLSIDGQLPLIHYRKRRGIISAPIAYAHAYPQHIPVIGPNGVPLETPEVVAAKANHAAAHIEAQARNGDLAVVSPLVSQLAAPWAAPIVAPVAYAAELRWAGPQHLPVIGPNGVPLDTPEVAAGKVANAVAHVEAKARNGDLAVLAHAVPLAVHQHIPVIGPNGVPLDTPEVAAGKIANAVAHAEAKARNGDLIYHY